MYLLVLVLYFAQLGDQTALPNMQYSLPFQYQSETAVPHPDHSKELYTESNTTMPQSQNVSNIILAVQNMKDTILIF